VSGASANGAHAPLPQRAPPVRSFRPAPVHFRLRAGTFSAGGASERARERARETHTQRETETETETGRKSWHKTEARVSGPCLCSLRSLPSLFGTAGLRRTSIIERSSRESKPRHSPSTSLWPKLNLELNQKEKEQHRRQGPPLTLHKPSSIVDFVSQVAGTPIQTHQHVHGYMV
jgi:hypothetical protein